MSADIHELRRARRREPLPIPANACRILSCLGFGVPPTMGRVTFSLSRSKQGVQVSMFAAASGTLGFQWNLSAMLNTWPANFAEARKWVAAYAARYGQTVEETRKEPAKRAVGADRKARKAEQCLESWLTSDIPELWAEAMVRCQHPAGHCGEDGYCHYGDCDMEMMPVPGEAESA